MAALARAALAAPAPTPQNPHIVLDGAVWPILQSPVLFERSFYAAFYDSVLGGARDGFVDDGVRYRSVCVSGNPGIGKSSFGYYALFRALCEGRTVVYQAEKLSRHIGGDEVYLFNGPAVSIDVRTIRAALNDPDTVFISDSITPVVVRAFTLYVTSPRCERTWEYRKTDNATMLYFPVLSWDEICEMRAACFPGVSEAGAKERYVRWGGIPRYVLGHSKEQFLLSEAIRSFAPNDLASFSIEPAASDDMKGSHRVFHVKVQGEVDTTLLANNPEFYRFHSREFASKHVARMLLEWGTSQLRAEMVRVFAGAAGIPQLAVARRHVYEELALERLVQGGRFPVRRLTSGASGGGNEPTGFLELPPARRHTFSDVTVISEQLADGQLEPASKSFCAIDAVLAGRLPANATTSKSHRLVLRAPSTKNEQAGPSRQVKAGLAAVVEALGLREGPIPFYWVVPPEVFDAWKRPQPMYSEGERLTAMGIAADSIGCRVEQYVLCVDVSAPLSAPVATPMSVPLSGPA